MNPAVAPSDDLLDLAQQLKADGLEYAPGVASDIAAPDIVESAYAETPLDPLLSLIEASKSVGVDRLGEITCPVLLLTSVNDHVGPPENSDHLAAGVSGPVERVMLERSYHVATLDFDRPEIERRSLAFAQKVTST